MNIKPQGKATPSSPTIIALFEGNKPEPKVMGKSKAELTSLHLKKKTFSAKSGEVLSTHQVGSNVSKVILFGLGKTKNASAKAARNMGAQMIRAAKGFKEKDISIVIPSELQEYLQAFAEGLIMGHYNPSIHKTGKEEEKIQKAEIKTVQLIASKWERNHYEDLDRAHAIGQVINYTRNIVNCGPRQLSISQFVKEIKEVAKKNKYKITDINKRKLERMGMGGILAVNRGSEEPAHMMILEHNANLKEAPIVLCGKGIIFDTGGVSLKPSTHMHEMQLDMGGAAVVLGVFKLLKKLNIKRRVVGIMPITDNAVGSKAYRPSEIISTYSGKTVEIMNTDAEGRMILCDALYYGATEYKPEYLIDLATLTGACMVALGYRTAGLFGNDDALIEKLLEAGKRTDEALCHLPITDADEKSMKGKIADLTNLAAERYGGASRAAAFLKNFIDKSKWAHIDIAGPAFTKEPKDYEVSMGTGYGVRLVVDFLEQL